MKTRTNDFDCVEMKNEIQRQLMAEYEANKDKYTSYADFINKTAEETELMKKLKAKLARSKRAA